MTPQEFNKKVKAIKKLSDDKKFKQSLGLFVKNMIYARTKLGQGVTSTNSNPEQTKNVKLAKLSDSYIKQRQGKLQFFTAKQGHVYALDKSKKFTPKKPTLGKLGKPTKSNLTYSGQMLEAMSFKITKTGAEIFIDNTSRDDDSNLSNNELAEIVSDARPFMNLSKREHERVIQFITDEIDRRLQKAFK